MRLFARLFPQMNAQKIVFRKPEGENYSVNLEVDDKVMLNLVLQYDLPLWIGPVYGTVLNHFECGKEYSVFLRDIKVWPSRTGTSLSEGNMLYAKG